MDDRVVLYRSVLRTSSPQDNEELEEILKQWRRELVNRR